MLRYLRPYQRGLVSQATHGLDADVQLTVGQHDGHRRVNDILAESQGDDGAEQPEQKAQEQAQRSSFDKPDTGGCHGDASGDIAADSGNGTDQRIAAR